MWHGRRIAKKYNLMQMDVWKLNTMLKRKEQ